LWYSIGVNVAISDGTADAKAGTLGKLNAPVATTTVGLLHSPCSVVTRYPSSVRRTEVTVVPSINGAPITLAYSAMKSATWSALMNPSGSSPR